MPDIDDILDAVDRIATVVSQLLSFMLIILLLNDALGINIIQLTWQLVKQPWAIPWEVIQQYWWLWRYMMFALIGVVVFDQAYTFVHQQRYGRPPGVKYARVISMVTFLLSFWLSLILRYASLMLIAVMSALSFIYTLARSE